MTISRFLVNSVRNRGYPTLVLKRYDIGTRMKLHRVIRRSIRDEKETASSLSLEIAIYRVPFEERKETSPNGWKQLSRGSELRDDPRSGRRLAISSQETQSDRKRPKAAENDPKRPRASQSESLIARSKRRVEFRTDDWSRGNGWKLEEDLRKSKGKGLALRNKRLRRCKLA